MTFRGLSAIAQAESLRYKLTYGLPVRKACYGILRFIMESGARGAEVIVSGKIKGQRAKAMKFCDGLMIHSGDPVNNYIDKAVRHVQLPQGILGIKVKIMLDHDSSGKKGPRKPLPDTVTILAAKEEVLPTAPYSENKIACYGILRFIMESGARGAEVIVSGKIKGQRAKAMKFCDGLMIHSGDPVNNYIDKAVRHVQLPQGILGIKVKIMLDHDSSGKKGPRKPLPDTVTILAAKEEVLPTAPYSENKM
uniref:40S ribosomal protein S3 n=1 Tax=Schistosoma haematobium TaxID=6185 RepID=A0A095A8J4_SCHHA